MAYWSDDATGRWFQVSGDGFAHGIQQCVHSSMLIADKLVKRNPGMPAKAGIQNHLKLPDSAAASLRVPPLYFPLKSKSRWPMACGFFNR
jgi:hypothetical protein